MEEDVNRNRPEEEVHPPPAGEPAAEHSLDALAKGLADRSLSRRDALKWVSGALLGGLLASIPGVALATHDERHNPHSQGGGACPEGLTKCQGRCVNLSNNNEHCGQCNVRCSPNVEQCVNGTCVGATSPPPVSPPPPPVSPPPPPACLGSPCSQAEDCAPPCTACAREQDPSGVLLPGRCL